MTPNKEEILEQLKAILLKLFDIAPETVSLESRLFEELDLDSIDAVDLIVQLQNLTKRKFSPEEFKTVRTVADVVDVIYAVLETPAAS